MKLCNLRTVGQLAFAQLHRLVGHPRFEVACALKGKSVRATSRAHAFPSLTWPDCTQSLRNFFAQLRAPRWPSPVAHSGAAPSIRFSDPPRPPLCAPNTEALP
jgi:hypothetical protein